MVAEFIIFLLVFAGFLLFWIVVESSDLDYYSKDERVTKCVVITENKTVAETAAKDDIDTNPNYATKI